MRSVGKDSNNPNIAVCDAVSLGSADHAELASKLNQLQELVRQKNQVELKLSQQLQETKKEMEKEREVFRAEVNERETRERALEISKRQLETQLTEVDRENYESLEELSLLQVCKKREKKIGILGSLWMRC